MLLMQHHQGGLVRRLYTIGIPNYLIKPFVAEMVKWEDCSGAEWTLGRLKSLKLDLIRRRNGQKPLTWIRKNRKGDVFGPIGSIFRWSDKSDRNFERAIQAFMAYSFYIFPKLTEQQKDKFLSGINPENADGLDEAFHRSFSQTINRTIRRRRVTMNHRPLAEYQGSPGKKAPTLFGRRSIIQDENPWRDLEIFNTDGGRYLYLKYQDLYDPLLVGVGSRRDYLKSLRTNNSYEFKATVLGGEIHFLQEPGGKLRSIASPFRIHQEALRPLGLEIYELVRQLPWDCTFDQSKAIPIIQSHLGKGGQVHSVDLSSATDHFPLSIQLTALRAIFGNSDHIDLFEEISRGEWKSPLGNLCWTKGQPLGLYPSFGSFTLTHGLLLFHLAGHFNDQFFVVGDDVLILNDKLKDNYISMLDRMSCPWSIDKSLSSNRLAEFAGKIITSKRVIPQLKWRRMSDDNFLDICRLLGRKSRDLLTERQKRVYDKVCNLCEPIGLNQSLPGDNLVKMVERTLDFYQPEKVVLGSLMGLRRRLHKLVYSSNEDTDSKAIQDLHSTFDEKVKSVLKQSVFSNWNSSCSIGVEGLSSIPEALELKPRLPLKEFTSARRSTLERYERLLV